MMGELGNFWQIGKLDKVCGKYERNGEVYWDVVGKRKCGKMCSGRCGKVCLRCGKCVDVGGEVWGEWKSMGRCGKCKGSVGKCVGVWGRCGKHGEVCLGVGRGVGNVLGWEEVRRSVDRGGGVRRCWKRYREC